MENIEKHFCVSVYVISEEGKFLLIKHKKIGKWLQPGGHIEMNEDPEEAAIREVYEETGYNVELLGERIPREDDYIQPLALQKNIIKENHVHIDFIYAAMVVSGSKTLNEVETNGIGWFTADEINNENFETFPDVKSWVKKLEKKY